MMTASMQHACAPSGRGMRLKFQPVSQRMAMHRPPVNIRKTAEAYEILMALPGYTREQLEIQVENGWLVIRGKQEGESPDFRRREFDLSEFKRSFRMPETVDAERIEAKLEQGLLLVRLPLREDEKPRQVTIA